MRLLSPRSPSAVSSRASSRPNGSEYSVRSTDSSVDRAIRAREAEEQLLNEVEEEVLDGVELEERATHKALLRKTARKLVRCWRSLEFYSWVWDPLQKWKASDNHPPTPI